MGTLVYVKELTLRPPADFAGKFGETVLERCNFGLGRAVPALIKLSIQLVKPSRDRIQMLGGSEFLTNVLETAPRAMPVAIEIRNAVSIRCRGWLDTMVAPSSELHRTGWFLARRTLGLRPRIILVPRETRFHARYHDPTTENAGAEWLAPT